MSEQESGIGDLESGEPDGDPADSLADKYYNPELEEHEGYFNSIDEYKKKLAEAGIEDDDEQDDEK